MEKDLIWLQTSLFADKSQWAFILHNGVKPFRKDASNEKLIEVLLIEFNYLSGENIRMAIQTEARNAELLASKLDGFFKEFFLSANIYKKQVTLPVDGIFLPFPPNTIQYGLYKILANADELASKIISKTSACIIEALENDTIDEEVLITFAFYLHIALITQLKKLPETNFSSMYNFEIYKNMKDVVDEDYLNQKYVENKDSLIEIEESIRNYELTELYENPSWLIEWIKNCKEIIVSQPSENPRVFVNIRDNINQQLGLTNNMIMLVNYFIHNIYAEKNLKSQ